MEPARTPGCRTRRMALGVAAFSITASALFKAALSGRSHTIPVRPSECGPLHLKWKQAGIKMATAVKRRRRVNTSSSGSLRMSPRSQIAETRPSHRINKDVLFTCFFPSLRLLSMAGVQEEEEVVEVEEVWSYFNSKVAGGVGSTRPGSRHAGTARLGRSERTRISAPEYFWPQLLAVIVIGRSLSPGNTGNSNTFQTKAPEGQRISGGYRWERAG